MPLEVTTSTRTQPPPPARVIGKPTEMTWHMKQLCMIHFETQPFSEMMRNWQSASGTDVRAQKKRKFHVTSEHEEGLSCFVLCGGLFDKNVQVICLAKFALRWEKTSFPFWHSRKWGTSGIMAAWEKDVIRLLLALKNYTARFLKLSV